MSAEPDPWWKREAVFAAYAPPLLLAACTIATAIGAWDPAVLVLSVATFAWLRLRPAGVYFPVLIGLSGALVVLQPWYGFFAFTNYFAAEELPAGWRRGGRAPSRIAAAGPGTPRRPPARRRGR